MCTAGWSVRVRAPSRLHFGLFAFGGRGRQYGGVGVMVRRPALELCIRRSHQRHARLLTTGRLGETVQRWLRFHDRDQLPACEVTIGQAVEAHVGLGSGTQLALALVAGLDAFCGYEKLDAVGLAQATGRGCRSAVGTYGFMMGGMIVERGKLADDVLAPLDCRLAFPAAWAWLLVRPAHGRGLSGAAERQAFGKLPPVAAATRQRLVTLARQQLVPAVKTGDFDRFSDHLYEYSRIAGACFARAQGGPYNGPELTTLVQRMRALGVAGVGQSSWGPTIFAVVRSEDQAAAVMDGLVRYYGPNELNIELTTADNDGARVASAPDEYCKAAAES